MAPLAVNTRIIMNAFRYRGLEGQAMFFWIGQRIQPLLSVAQEVVARGYGVGNHSWSHQYSGQWTYADYLGRMWLSPRSPGGLSHSPPPSLPISGLNDQAMRDYRMCNLFT